MQTKGSVLIVLLIMLIFASVALLQLSEDNYFTHLIATHLDDLSQARHELSQAFKKTSAMPVKNQACYSEADNKSELEDFWDSGHLLCQIKISNQIVDYAFRLFQQDERETSYLQVTLRVKNNNSSVWLRVVMEQKSKVITSWLYFD
jgi:hypothetical protein